MKYRSPKQRMQWELTQALGTCKGFPGYLNNLERLLLRTELRDNEWETLFGRVRNHLEDTEARLRDALKHIDRYFPLESGKSQPRQQTGCLPTQGTKSSSTQGTKP